MKYIHVKNLNKFYPTYKDRTLQWAKVFFNMVQGDPEFEMVDNETDKWRFIAFICLELQAQQPIPLDDEYLTRKGFDLKKRPIDLTIKMLHKFLETVSQNSKVCVLEEYKEEEYKEEEKEKGSVRHKYGEYKHVLLTDNQYEKLIKDFGQIDVNAAIKILDEYIQKSGKKYKDFNLVLRSWPMERVRKEESPMKGWNK